MGKAMATNKGLISLELSGIRVDGSVCDCFIHAFESNFTLCKLVWDPESSGFNLKFTEMVAFTPGLEPLGFFFCCHRDALCSPPRAARVSPCGAHSSTATARLIARCATVSRSRSSCPPA